MNDQTPKRRRNPAHTPPRSIANYTTEKSVRETVSEIHELLVQAGASDVLFTHSDYNGTRVASAVSFRIRAEFGPLSFRMPTDHESVYKRLLDSDISPKLQTRERASRVSWRIICHWLQQQLAMIAVGLVRLE